MPSEFFFAVRKGDTELLNRINYAIDQVNAVEGNWQDVLLNRYYSEFGNRNLEFTEEEKAVIAQYSTEETALNILCDPTRYPYSYLENGEVKGILPDYFRMLADDIGLAYHFWILEDRDDYIAHQTSPELGIILDTREVGSAWKEKNRCPFSAPYITMRMAMVTRRDFDGTIRKVATVSQKLVSTLDDAYAKNAEKIIYDTRDEAMQAVKQGKADVAFVYQYMAQACVNQDTSGLLTYTLLEEPTYEYFFGFGPNVNHSLPGILTKAIYAVPDGMIEDISNQYTSYQAKDVTLWMLIRLHPLISVGMLLLFVAAIVAFLMGKVRTQKRLAQLADQRAEEMKEWADKMDAANRAKTDFLANMSHDIRTPMNAIVGITKLMEHDQNDPEKMEVYIHKVQTSSHHLLSLINDVLDMSKIESSEVRLNQEPVSIAEEVAQVDSIIRPEIAQRNQNFVIRVHEIAHEYLLGDAVRLRQVYINLLSNAVKYTPKGGSIQMDIAELPSENPDYALICTTVTDNGCGMSEEFLKRIFDPFTRAENSTTNKVQGTGLGMAITKKIVDLMGGTITVRSEPGKGSCFRVTIPLLIDKEARHRIDAKGVLLVASEEMLIRNVSASFRESGIPLYIARTKQEVETVLTQNNVDTVLLAGHLHDRHLREIIDFLHEETKNTILVFCVDYEQQEEAGECLKKSGADGLIARPFFLSNFAGVVNELRGDAVPKKTEDGSMLKGMKFLCAEDNTLNAEILDALLDMQGASCVIYPDGEKLTEAFKLVKPGDFDAILMDVQMPVMNGLDATRAIRSGDNPLGRTIPIIAMTANAFSSDVRACLEAGMDAHVPKPLDIAALERTLKAVFDRNASGGHLYANRRHINGPGVKPLIKSKLPFCRHIWYNETIKRRWCPG